MWDIWVGDPECLFLLQSFMHCGTVRHCLFFAAANLSIKVHDTQETTTLNESWEYMPDGAGHGKKTLGMRGFGVWVWQTVYFLGGSCWWSAGADVDRQRGGPVVECFRSTWAVWCLQGAWTQANNWSPSPPTGASGISGICRGGWRFYVELYIFSFPLIFSGGFTPLSCCIYPHLSTEACVD